LLSIVTKPGWRLGSSTICYVREMEHLSLGLWFRNDPAQAFKAFVWRFFDKTETVHQGADVIKFIK
jgi:hypothetical protein